MPTSEYMRVTWAIQYTGSNGPEVVSNMNGMQLISDVGGVLKVGDLAHNEVFFTFATGDWWDKSDQSYWAASEFPMQHITKAAALLDTNTVYDPTAVNASIASLTTAVGGKLAKVDLVSISVPVLLLNATADRVVTWNRPFNNTNYDLSYAFDASTIGRITCAPVAGTKTTTGVTIRITAGLLAVSVLGVVHVLGIGA